MTIALRVLLPLPLPPFSFLPPHDASLPAPGCRVLVPWQGGSRLGIVSGHEALKGGAGLDLRETIAPYDLEPFLTDAALTLIRDLARMTATPEGLVLSQLLPSGLNERYLHEVQTLPGVEGLELPADTWLEATTIPPTELDFYRRQGLLRERVRRVMPQVQVVVPLKRPDAALENKAQAAQREALEHLWSIGQSVSAAALARDADVSPGAVSALVRKGYAGYTLQDAPPAPLPQYPSEDTPPPAAPPSLPELSRLSLSGGTRGGRLQALLPLLKDDLRSGSVLILVPEVSLIPETARALASLPVMVLSGELNDAQRSRLLEELPTLGSVVLIGTFLALLAPLQPLARVVVLEEGRDAYKLPAGCRVFVPTAARTLAEAAGAKLLLTDALATPETVERLEPDARVNLPDPLPRAHVVDLGSSSNWPLSAELILVLKQVQGRERQAILLAPRRGFSAALRCADCDYLAMCPNCDLPLRYHLERYALKCHQCEHREQAPPLCPNCQGTRLSPTRAAGTQWVSEAVTKLLPGFPVLRYDGDQRDDLSGLMAGEPGVLVATTAILRHPPLPNVSLVGVTLLDTMLNMADFRAEEATYRALLQLHELSPGKRPLQVIQTFQHDHPLLEHYLQGDAEGFIRGVLERRARFRYPPFSLMTKVQLSARQKGNAERAAERLAGVLRTAGASESELLGPTPAPVTRIKAQYSYQLLLRSHDPLRLETLMGKVSSFRDAATVRLDLDPRGMAAFLED